MKTCIVWAQESDAAEILDFVRALAVYEKLENEVVATEASIRETLFGPKKYAEVLFLEEENTRVGFALFFTTTRPSSESPGFISRIFS